MAEFEFTTNDTNNNNNGPELSGSAKEVSDILDAVSGKVPKLLKGIVDAFYSPEAGANMGKSVGAFYSSLVEAGIPAEDALKMAKDYMISISKLSDMVSDSVKNNG